MDKDDLRRVQDFFDNHKSEYLYWDEFKYKKYLPFLEDTVKSSALVKLMREIQYQKICIRNYYFQYSLTTDLQKDLCQFDIIDINLLQTTKIMYNNPLRVLNWMNYLNLSLYNEAVVSYQISKEANQHHRSIFGHAQKREKPQE